MTEAKLVSRTWNQLIVIFKKTYFAITDLAFPTACVGCENFGPWLCADCLKSLTPPIETCIYCKEKTLHGVTCAVCRRKFHLSGVIFVGEYKNKTLREAVHTLKFSGVRDLAEPLGDLLAKNILQTLGNNLNQFTLIPLPLHKKRQNERGFNQSQLLANRISSLLAIPSQETLVRTKSAAPQASLNPEIQNLRANNITGVFSINSSYQATIPEKIIIVDDVSTTGATLEEAASILAQNGTKEIWGAVVCRG